jgi:hypothetical protein
MKYSRLMTRLTCDKWRDKWSAYHALMIPIPAFESKRQPITLLNAHSNKKGTGATHVEESKVPTL